MSTGTTSAFSNASTTVVTPPQRRREHVPNSKSSESLPSPSELIARAEPRLKTGSRSAALPQNAAIGFQTTSTLLKYNLLSLHKEPEERTAPVKKKTKTGQGAKADHAPKEKKQRAKKSVAEENVATKKARKTPAKELVEKPNRPRKRKSDEMEQQPGAGPARPREKSGKSLAEQSGANDETTESSKSATNSHKRRKPLEKEKADEINTTSKRIPSKSKKKTSKCSSHFADNGEEFRERESGTGNLAATEAASAVKRKQNWTPPKSHDVPAEVDMYSVPSSSPAALSKVYEAPKLDFAALQTEFGYQVAAHPTTSPTRDEMPVSVMRPGKRIELVPDLAPKALHFIHEQPGPVVAIPTKDQREHITVPDLARPVPAKGAKKASPKKGPGGITARSIARYATVVPPAAEPVTKTSPHLAPVFNNPAIAADQVSKEPADAKKKATKPRKSRGKKANKENEAKKKTSANSKVVAIVAPKLASPKQHEAKLRRQDLLFGTSSQLRQDLSPNMVKTLQESLHDAVLVEQEHEERHSSPIPMRYAGAIRRTKGKLWAESTHENIDRGWQRLSDFEAMNDGAEAAPVGADVPPIDDLPSSFDAFGPTTPEQGQDPPPVASNGFWLSKGEPVPASQPSGLQGFQPAMAPIIISSSSPRLAVSPPRVALRPLSTNTKSPTKQRGSLKPQTILTTSSREDVNAPKENDTKRPRGRPRKDTQLATLTSPGKPRGRPRKVSAPSHGPQTPKKRGRPRKPLTRLLQPDDDSNTEFQHIDDIEDSEVDHTPTPKKRGSPSASQPLPLTTSTETETTGKRINTALLDSSHPRWPEVKAKLFPEITDTVKSAPPTNSIKNPTWHEKMLLYDPIVLEDITSWLNDQGLRVEGKDGALIEVSCWMTQAWCEANSICCLWKEGLRGGVRTRY
jgi:hypothetical protein